MYYLAVGVDKLYIRRDLMLANTKETTVTCGNYVILEEFVKERSATDALFQFYSRKVKESYATTH